MNVIAIITGILSMADQLSNLYRKTVEAARQNGELTPEQEAEFNARFEAMIKRPEWQVRPDPTPNTETR